MWECKFCRRMIEDTDTTCWSCNGKKEDVELLEGEKPETIAITEINNSANKISKKKRNLAFKIGLIFTILGFGGWIIATIALESMDKSELLGYTFKGIFGGKMPEWLTLLLYAKKYGAFLGIGGVVLWVIGLSLDKNRCGSSS